MTAAAAMQTASDLQRHGAFCFGLVVGWNLYFLNRYRKDVALADLGTLIAAIGGGAVLALFPAKTDLFGAYGVGLAVGFFGYFLLVVILALLSKNFGVDYLIDGRRKRLGPDEERSPTPDRPMEATDTTLPPGT